MEDYIGMIRWFGGNFAIRNYAKCEGQLLSINSNTALFSIIGTTFGGDGRTTFGLPDLRGRAAIGTGTGPGLSPISWGQKGGAQQIQLSTAQLPSHAPSVTGSIKCFNGGGDETGPNGSVPSVATGDNYSTETPNGTMAASMLELNVAPVGSGQSVNIQNPYLGITTLICLFGLFPPRS